MKLINITLLILFFVSFSTYVIATEYPRALPAPTTIDDIIQLSQSGVSDEIIISQIKATQTIFYLSKEQIIELKQAGVSDVVIDFMINTSLNIPRAILVEPELRVRYYYSYDPWYDYWWNDPWYDDWRWRRRRWRCY